MLLGGLLAAVLLSGCQSSPIGGPAAPADATDAGELTLPSGRSYRVYPEDLAYDGTASYRWPDGRQYEGQFVAGLPQGIGVGVWPNGDRYRGTWHEGFRHGHGELTRVDGTRYVGDFANGLREGAGAEQSADGLYRGQWQADLPDGHGEFHGNDGTKYRGQWRAGQRAGQGTFIDQNGNVYEGEWRNDLPDGFGRMSSISGASYEGQWLAGHQHGYGKAVTPTGASYEGTWEVGKRSGFGVTRRTDGSGYEGEWLDDERHGQGRQRFTDGSYYEGAWQSGRAFGPGAQHDSSGIVISGIWDGENLTDGSLRLPSGQEYHGPILTRRNTAVSESLLQWLGSRAREDDPWAHYYLGKAHSEFSQPAADLFKATTHFRAAARAGVTEAQYRLAMLLMEKSPDRAVPWLEKAALADHAQASSMLGELYLAGDLVQRDLAKAIGYLSTATAAGDLQARNNLAWVLATTADPEYRDGDEALALIRPLVALDGDWQHLDTLAAAYAATGDFSSAEQTQREAIVAAETSLGAANDELTALRRRLARYQAGESITQ